LRAWSYGHDVAGVRAARFVAAGFGIGYAPIAAGTVASAAAVVTGAGLLLLSPWLLACAMLFATIGGYLAVKRSAIEGDPGWVVIDEFAGQWIALLALARPTVPGLVAAFILFRVLDITKLGPIGWTDRQHGAFGIMADDVIAGIIAAGPLILIRLTRPEWLM
jgi:phosphatidylglycerophosphatase A